MSSIYSSILYACLVLPVMMDRNGDGDGDGNGDDGNDNVYWMRVMMLSVNFVFPIVYITSTNN